MRERERERRKEKKREKQKEILVCKRGRCWSEVVGGGRRHIREILRKNSRSGGSANYSDGS